MSDNLDKIKTVASDLISDLNLEFRERRSLLRAVKSYYTSSIPNKTNFSTKLKKEVNKYYCQRQHLSTKDALREIEQALTKNLKAGLTIEQALAKNLKAGSTDEVSLKAAIICEIVVSEI